MSTTLANIQVQNEAEQEVYLPHLNIFFLTLQIIHTCYILQPVCSFLLSYPYLIPYILVFLIDFILHWLTHSTNTTNKLINYSTPQWQSKPNDHRVAHKVFSFWVCIYIPLYVATTKTQLAIRTKYCRIGGRGGTLDSISNREYWFSEFWCEVNLYVGVRKSLPLLIIALDILRNLAMANKPFQSLVL